MPAKPLAVGERVRFPRETGSLWWTVQAVSPRFAILTQHVPFQPNGTLRYTVLDVEAGIRGACNLIGYGWGDGTYSRTQCEAILAEFESGELEISHRNHVRTVTAP